MTSNNLQSASLPYWFSDFCASLKSDFSSANNRGKIYSWEIFSPFFFFFHLFFFFNLLSPRSKSGWQIWLGEHAILKKFYSHVVALRGFLLDQESREKFRCVCGGRGWGGEGASLCDFVFPSSAKRSANCFKICFKRINRVGIWIFCSFNYFECDLVINKFSLLRICFK